MIFVTFRLSCIAILFGSLNCFAMGGQSPQIYVENVETGYVYDVPLSLTYTHKGKKKHKDLNAGIPESIGSLSEIQDGTALVFSGRGTTLTATPLSITKEQLIQEFEKNKGSSEDALFVALSASGVRAPYILTATYKLQQPEKTQQRIEERLALAKPNIFTLFPRIVYWNLQSKLSQDAIINAKSWKDILVPADLIRKSTTAEDVFRYILEIRDHLYTREQVEQAFRDRSKQWHPDKVQDKELKAFAHQVFILLKAAQEGLLKAIEEKPELQTFNKKEKEAATEGWVLLSDNPQ